MPVHQRKRPTIIRMQGNRTHCEVELPRAGQKKAASGNAGFSFLVIASIVVVPLELLVTVSAFRFLRGRCDEDGGMLGWVIVVETSQWLSCLDEQYTQ